MSEAALEARAALESQQLARLRDLLAQLESNPFQRARLRAAGLVGPPSDLDLFRERAPLTTKADLARDQAEHTPYGTNLTYPLESYVRLHQTSSTTGAPLRWLDTAESWSSIVDAWCTVFAGAGVGAADRVFVAFSFGPFIGLWSAFDASHRLGALTIPGGGMTSATRLRAILANDVTVLCCTPTYAVRLGEVADEEGIDLSASSVRAIVVGGEPGASIPATRARIESYWPGARVYDHYGMTEVGPVTFQCPADSGHVHVMESHYLCEIIDPASGAPVPESSDEVGELVLTTLLRTGSPVLRYRTGDLVQRGPGTCACGRVGLTFAGGVRGRADDMVVGVRGVNLYPASLENIVRARADVAEYRVEISQVRGMTELEVCVEPVPGCDDDAGLCGELEAAFRHAFGLRIPVTAAAPGALPRFELKARRWVRRADDASAAP